VTRHKVTWRDQTKGTTAPDKEYTRVTRCQSWTYTAEGHLLKLYDEDRKHLHTIPIHRVVKITPVREADQQ